MKILIIFIMLAISFVVGISIIPNKEISKIDIKKIMLSFIFGFIVMITLYEVLYIIFFLSKAKLNTLNIVYSIVLLSIASINIYRIVKYKIRIVKIQNTNYKSILILFGILIIIIFSQIIFLKNYSFYYGYASDEYAYAATSSLSLYSNKIINNSENEIIRTYNPHSSLCCWETFITWFVWLFNIDVAETLHLYLPVYILLLVYCVYALFSIKIFKDNQNRLLFLIFSVLLTWYACYAWNSVSEQIIGTPWYGRSAMFVVIIPLLLYLILGNIDKYEYVLTHLTIFAGCSISMTGMMTIGFMIGCLFLSNLIIKNIKKSLWVLSYELIPLAFLFLYIVGR